MKFNTSTKAGLGIGIVGAVVTTIMIVLAILRSTSSTAGIGFIFVPIYFAASFVGFFILGYCIGYIKTWVVTTPRIFKPEVGLAIVVGSCLAVFVIAWSSKGLLLTSVVSQIGKEESSQQLLNAFEDSYFKNNKFVLGAIAQNPAASAGLLDGIARLSDPELHKKMQSLFPLLGNNRKGLAVMRLVVRNQNVSASTIEYLASISKDDYVLSDIAVNPKTSDETLKRLETKNNYLIDWGLAQNPRIHPTILTKLLDREKYFTQRTTLELLLRNPSAPAEIRTRASELLKAY